ncbi:MAG: hypothetical protein WCZ19_04380 [Acholeplasma sp.]
MARVIDLSIAIGHKDKACIQTHVRDDFVLKMIGTNDAFDLMHLDEVSVRMPDILEMNITNALSHGNAAMCEGIVTLKDKSVYSFCFVVKFVNTAKHALIKSGQIYIIKKTIKY